MSESIFDKPLNGDLEALSSSVVKSINGKKPDPITGDITVIEGGGSGSYGAYRLNTTIPVSSWSGSGPYTVTVANELIKSTMDGKSWLDNATALLGETTLTSQDGSLLISTTVKPTEDWVLHVSFALNGADVLADSEEHKKAIGKILPIITGTLNNSGYTINSGDYFEANGNLYKASAIIPTNESWSSSSDALTTSALSDIHAKIGDVGSTSLQSQITTLNGNSVALARHTRKTDFALADLQAAVAEQNLAKYGLKPGDQKTINGYTYVIAGLNEMKGIRTCTSNHVALIVIPHITQAWNASGHTYEGADGRGAGYLNSDLHYYLTNTVLPHVQNDLGSGHLYAHRKLLTNAVNQTGYNRFGQNTGCSSGWMWTDPIYIAALSEVQVYGAAIWSSSGYDTGEACKQLAVFEEYKNTDIFGGEHPWLMGVVSASAAAYSDNGGGARCDGASAARYVAGLILYH